MSCASLIFKRLYFSFILSFPQDLLSLRLRLHLGRSTLSPDVDSCTPEKEEVSFQCCMPAEVYADEQHEEN